MSWWYEDGLTILDYSKEKGWHYRPIKEKKMPFMKWEKTSDGYKPVEITDEEMEAQNAVKKEAREKAERISEQLEIVNDKNFDRIKDSIPVPKVEPVNCKDCDDTVCCERGKDKLAYCPRCFETKKEKKMEFDKSRVFTAVNADELRAGDKVIVADCLADLKEFLNDEGNVVELEGVRGENCNERFRADYVNYALAYLVERAENCTNCEGCVACIKPDKAFRCDDYEPKTKEKTCLYCNHYSTDFCYKNHHVTKNYNKACADFDDTPVKKIDRKVYEYYNTKTEQEKMCLNCKHYNEEHKTKKEIDMWNYVSEGKLPERQEMGVSDRVVVAVRGYNSVDVGYYDYELEAWFVMDNRYPVPVYAWHYDKPPREA